MPNYRRMYVSGGTYFFTIVTYQRQPIFTNLENISRLRKAIATVKKEMPFIIIAAVVLPDNLHFIWQLPPGDSAYSKRIGKMKVLFTQSLPEKEKSQQESSISRLKHRESNIWQRRFWEHTIRDEEDLENYLNYIHYNPVKHNLVSCPHLWQYSSFHSWVKNKGLDRNWGCVCN